MSICEDKTRTKFENQSFHSFRKFIDFKCYAFLPTLRNNHQVQMQSLTEVDTGHVLAGRVDVTRFTTSCEPKTKKSRDRAMRCGQSYNSLSLRGRWSSMWFARLAAARSRVRTHGFLAFYWFFYRPDYIWFCLNWNVSRFTVAFLKSLTAKQPVEDL